MHMKFSYKRLLLPVLLILLTVLLLKWAQKQPAEDVRLTNEQLKVNEQQWATQNQQEILSRQEKLGPAQ